MRKKTKAVSTLPKVSADENGGVGIAEGDARVELATIRENPDNPQTVTDEEFGKLRDSMRRLHRFLRARPILVEADGTIKCGNKRFRALVENGVRFVPADYVRMLTDYTPEEVREFILQDNIQRGEWDVEKLLAQYERDELNEVGLDDLLAELSEEDNAKAGQTDEDAVPKAPETPVSCRGEVYQCGEHRLMCGDSTSAADMARLMGGAQASVFVFDPPYEMPEMYDLIPRNEGGALLCFSDHKHFHEPIAAAMRAGWTPRFELIWDCVQSWYTPNRPLARHKSCTVYGDREKWNFDAAVIRDGKRREAHTVHNTRGDCDYIPLDGAVHLRTVEAFANTAQNDENGYGKPVEWISAILNGYAPSSCIVADMFCGSGAFIIACEKTGRVCFGMELDPHYCDVIRKRWAEFTHGEGCDWQALTPCVTNAPRPTTND